VPLSVWCAAAAAAAAAIGDLMELEAVVQNLPVDAG